MLATDFVGSAMYFLILVKTRMGKQEEAIEMLKRAIDYKLPLVLLVYTEPLIKSLRTHPSFQELMNPIFGKATTFDLSKKKYKKSLLDRKLIDQYKQQLKTLMLEKEPYLNSELTRHEQNFGRLACRLTAINMVVIL